ncbi:hypothetical protein QR680_018862 [Steinernema hermaphroditum]|uniref:Uncharacterized protein n=1 Tax=Steinernema hermaphroditum TaxID=289476 RepID=A0AA39LQZ8_9BILA|nr:hypothetical protein QR680_018862 [Steinernema hermaphroditum]
MTVRDSALDETFMTAYGSPLREASFDSRDCSLYLASDFDVDNLFARGTLSPGGTPRALQSPRAEPFTPQSPRAEPTTPLSSRRYYMGEKKHRISLGPDGDVCPSSPFPLPYSVRGSPNQSFVEELPAEVVQRSETLWSSRRVLQILSVSFFEMAVGAIALAILFLVLFATPRCEQVHKVIIRETVPAPGAIGEEGTAENIGLLDILSAKVMGALPKL